MAKKIKKIIPKEIKPALPALAAIFGPAALATYGPAAFSGTGVLASLPARAMISSAIAQAATEGKIDPKDTLLAGGQAYLGQKLSAYGQPTLSGGAQGPITGKEQGFLKSLASKTGEFLAPTSPQQLMEGRFTSAGDALGLLKAGVKSAIPQASVAYAEEAKLLNEKALRDYEAQLREQGIMDSADRRNKIYGYFAGALNTKTGDRLYSDDEINSFLDKYGYATGGAVAARRGLVNRPGGYAGDRKMAAQEYAEELAQDKYGKDFYDLPQTVQMDLYQMALDFVDEGMADGGIAGFKKGGVIKAGLREFAEDFEKRLKNSRQELKKGGNAGLVAELMRLKDDKGKPLYTFEEAISKVDEEFPEEFDSKSLSSGLEGIMSGYKMATGQSLMGLQPQPTRFGLAEGGIPVTPSARKTIRELIEAGMLEDEGEGILDLIRKNPDMIGGPIMPIRPETFDLESYKIKAKNLPMFVENFIDDFKRENGRNPTIQEIKMYANKVTPFGFAEGGMLNTGGREMDMRGGGFIPIGSRERADDVPARLSKNEFVMTADAVRAAGGGSINRGAKRMYDLMNRLEAKA